MGRGLVEAASGHCSERTLRRYVSEGLLHGERRDGRGEVRISPSEERYLRRHWTVLSRLRRALRTEPSVRVAVLFGSTAVGEERPDSDVDLLVDHATGDLIDVARLQGRLRERVGREVHVVLLQDAKESPTLLADIVVEGRVIVNRGDAWGRLIKRRKEILSKAAAEAKATRGAALRAIDEARDRVGA